MNDGDIVADASAVIALLVGEPFLRFEPQRLGNALISAVNLSEVLARLLEIGMPESEADTAVAKLNLRVVAFDEPQASATARLRSVTRHAGLSLGDRLDVGVIAVVTEMRLLSQRLRPIDPDRLHALLLLSSMACPGS